MENQPNKTKKVLVFTASDGNESHYYFANAANAAEAKDKAAKAAKKHLDNVTDITEHPVTYSEIPAGVTPEQWAKGQPPTPPAPQATAQPDKLTGAKDAQGHALYTETATKKTYYLDGVKKVYVS